MASAKPKCSILPDDIDLVPSQSPQVTSEFVDGTHMVPAENPDIIVPHVMHLIERTGAPSVKNTAQAKL
ncbi:hypothetical protein EC973_004125 [Apophysomyces ossiformis]|uniref:Uncharacterized protein n=1 Tax=Apophysomyces ossiformis TaxID=679940 RepID=A0A8H7ELY1_9FUNG|nr:hypothetical protein EC973_004125 [Apophysomyces ossiformis]